jgi:inorganic pyrophosphatase
MPEIHQATQYIGQTVLVTVDRPLGSCHPDHNFTYLVNYGYLAGIPAPDGEDLDAYVLGIDRPLTSFEGICMAVIHRLDDADDKLVVVPPGFQLTDEEIRAQTHFQEQWFRSVILRDNGRKPLK